MNIFYEFCHILEAEAMAQEIDTSFGSKGSEYRLSQAPQDLPSLGTIKSLCSGSVKGVEPVGLLPRGPGARLQTEDQECRSAVCQV